VRRRKGSRPARTTPGRFERVLFSFMGPPQLGDLTAPPTATADPAADLCPRCEAPWAAHTTVRTASRGYLTCPEPTRGDNRAGR
jgi:hypothetical protein